MGRWLLWPRMVLVAWRLAWPYLLTPWRSPLVRWRLETFGMRMPDGRLLHAGDVTPALFFRFLTTNRRAFLQFLRWAASI